MIFFIKYSGIIFIGFLISLSAQSQSIKGKLTDVADNTPLAGATVSLQALKDSNFIKQTLSDSTGRFFFGGLPADSFLLRVSSVGYSDFKQYVFINDSLLNNDLGTVLVPKVAIELGGVVVVSKTPPITQKGDTTQYSASQFKVNPDATTEDLLKKMPGVTVDKDGSVTAQGEKVRKVTVDGKEFFGDDATAALKNLPSEVVDKIQIFDRLSEQAQFTGFDDGNSEKSINIVTKSGIRNGQFGRLYAGYGSDQRYMAGGNASIFNGDTRFSIVGNFNNINQQNFASQDLLGVTSSGGGNRGGGGRGGFRGGSDNFSIGSQRGINKTNALGLNFSDKWGKKMDVQGSYFFNNSDNTNNNQTSSQTLFNNKTQYADQKTVSNSINNNHRINLRLEYKIDSNNTIMIRPNLSFQDNKSSSLSDIQNYFGTNDTASTSSTSRESMRNGYNLRNDILYRHSFAKRGRTLSLNLGTSFSKNDGEGYNKAYYRFFDESLVSDSTQDQFTVNPTNGYNLSANLAYTEPIGKKGQLQFNYSPSYGKNKANQKTYSFDPDSDKYSDFDTTLSNQFENTTTTHNGGISYRMQAGRDNSLSFGVNLQHSQLESERVFPVVTSVDQSFTNLLPNFMFRRKLSAKSYVRIFYRARTNFPNVNQLQDVVNFSNPLRVSSGNPDLKQSYSNFGSARYTYTNALSGQAFIFNVYGETTKDYISNATFSPREDSTIQQGLVLKKNSQFTKPVNLDGYKSFRTYLTYSFPLKFIKSNFNLNTGFSYSNVPGLINYVSTTTKNYTYSAGAGLASNISEYVDFNLSYTANFNNAKSSIQQNDNKYFNQSAGLQMNLLSKNGWFLQNDISNQFYSGLSDGYNQSFWLWNAGIGKKFLANKAAELKLSVFDLLKQNQSLVRTVTENYIEDSRSLVLQQYIMLTFTYNLKNFGKGRPQQNRESRMREWNSGGRPGDF